MQLDALTLAALADELRERLVGARIDDVIQPTPQAVALQCWGGGRNFWLLASAHPQLARAQIVERKPKKLVQEPPTFVMLLRKYVEGARVTAIRQPAWERLLEIGFAHGPAAATGATEVWLILEVMGNISNLILRDEAGIVLGALHLIPPEKNRYRTILPNVPYRYPPPQTRTLHGETLPRLHCMDVMAEELREAAEEMLSAPPAAAMGRRGRRAQQGPTVIGLLSSQIEGFSRDLASEVAARALGEPDVPLAADLPWGRLAHETRELAGLMETRAWQPTLVYATRESAQPSAFAVYTPQRFVEAELRAAPDVNTMLAMYFEGAEWHNAVEGAKSNLRHILQIQLERCIRKDEVLHAELRQLDEAQRLREEADTLLAFQNEVPPHATSYSIENLFAEPGSVAPATMTLALDPRFSAVENANLRYNRYHKLQRAAGLIPPQIEANMLERARIEQLQTDLALAETPTEIAQVRAEVAEAGYIRGEAHQKQQARAGKSGKGDKGGKPGKGGKSGKGNAQTKRGSDGGTPLRRQSSDGFALLVGKNSRQNEAVTFGEAGANDTWLHARGVPGAHVIVKSGGRPVPETTLREAAALAAYYSQSRAAGSVPVDHTQQRYVRHMKGGGPGMVIYERERTLHVAPEDVGGEA